MSKRLFKAKGYAYAVYAHTNLKIAFHAVLFCNKNSLASLVTNDEEAGNGLQHL